MRFLLIFVFFVTLLQADRDGGPYLGFGYGSGVYFDDGLDTTVKENKSNSITIYGGAYINKHLSVELTYVSFDGRGMGDGYLSIDKTNKERAFSFSTYTTSTLAHYAFFDDSLDFYARFGAGEIKSKRLASNGFAMLFGVGVGYRISEMFSVKVAYDVYQFGYDEDNDDSSDYKRELEYFYSAIEVQF